MKDSKIKQAIKQQSTLERLFTLTNLGFDTNTGLIETVDRKTSLLTTGGYKLSNKALSLLSSIQTKVVPVNELDEDEIDTVEGSTQEPTVDVNTLPAIINMGIRAQGNTTPNWHRVKNLPGLYRGPIRELGKQVFTPFTHTKIDDVNVVAFIKGANVNSLMEVNSIAGYAAQYGILDIDGTVTAEDILPQYEAQIKLFKTPEVTFLMVVDFMGNYIYSWPTCQNKISNNEKPLLK